MISFKVGDILESSAEALINTVNCEGYMGKGIAYQFKLRYPSNNKKYREACSSGSFKIGSILAVLEGGKLILNFPTKDKWREKSEYSFINKGMSTLTRMLPNLNVKSIAFPPLGCGNGGLDWREVKKILTEELKPYEHDFDFILYEPSNQVSTKGNIKTPPKLNSSHIILMHLKLGLNKFNKTRLQKVAFLLNLFAHEEYFKFSAYNYGPYTHTIDILSRDIKEYQQYFNFSTNQALIAAENTLMSNSLIEKLDKFIDPITKSLELVNRIESDSEIELLTTILYILHSKKTVKLQDFPVEFLSWSEDKAARFSNDDIFNEIDVLSKKGLVRNSLLGVELAEF